MTSNGGSSKPCLGYSSRSAAIRGLRSNGMTNRQIAEKTGIPIRAVPFHVGSYPHDVKKFRAS